MSDLTRSQWNTLLADADGRTFGDLVAALKDADIVSVEDPDAFIDDAIATGPLEEDPDAGMFGEIHLSDEPEPAEPADTGDSNPEDTDSESTNPGREPGESDTHEDTDADDLHERSLEAFAAAIEFFNQQLDRDISHTFEDAPATPREYYEEYRGWESDTIATKHLGYAPADENALLDYLMRRGFDGEAIQGTGLFYSDFTPHFQGRYVLPYFDEDGNPVYAISRSLNHHEDGHPRDPKGDQKYTKAIKTKDRTFVDEPIYGADTVAGDTDRLLVAGGIADAISIHEAGFACVSPVTTVRFKNKHEPRVVDLVEEYDLDGVYMLNDAERATIDKTELPEDETADTIGDVLTIQQYGEGLRGAFGNAEFLLKEDVDPYLVTLPGGDDDLRKLDPDDYIKNSWGSIDAILRSARHANDHPGYQEWTSRRRDRAVTSAIQTGDDASRSFDTSTDGTDLFDLSFPEVSGLSVGERLEENPLGHHGNSYEYFVCADKRGFVHGYDHKYNVAYNGVSWLLCDAGVRPADDPNGRLSPLEVFQAWEHAKSNGHLPEDDPVPYRALRAVAVDDGVVAREDLIERDTDSGAVVEDPDAHEGGSYTALPSGTYNDVLQHIEDTYGVDPGRDPISGTGGVDVDPTAALPLEILDTLDHDEARRFAQKRGVEWSTTKEAREELRNQIFETMRHGDVKVLDAPTALGKSYTVATEPWLRRSGVTGDQPVIHTHETREARDQAAEQSDSAGRNHITLKGRTEACPVAGGEYNPDTKHMTVTMNGAPASEWFRQVCEGRGLPFSVAHKYLDDHNDQGVDLPCCAEDGEQCPAIAQWNGVPRDDGGEPAADVIHCTHGFAHVPSLRNMTNVIFDERPEFKTDLAHERVRTAVAAYLTAANAPVDTWEQFVTAALEGDDPNEHGEHATIRDALDHEPDREWYLESDGAHTLAPALTRAIYYALKSDDEDGDDSAQDANGRYSATVSHEPPRLDADASNEDGWNRTWLTVVLDENNTVRTVRNAPDFSGSRSVIGLDAHPSMTQWQRNTHPDIRIRPILDPTERALWRRYERGLLTIGVGEATRPFTSGEYFDEDGSRAFFAALRDQFGEDFRTAITAASVEHDTEQILHDVGVENPDTMHYGEEKSRNDFGDENVGALNGCIDPGDDFVLDLLAEAELDATPETTTDADGDEHRAHGRGFTGPDADAANEILASVREQHIAQSAGRYARNADDPDDQAIVFVRTDAAPTGFLDMRVPGVVRPRTDTQRDIISTLRERPHATAGELADAVECSKEHVRTTLSDLADEDVVDVREHAGDHGAHLYRALAGIDVAEHGSTDFTPTATADDETTNDHVCSLSTWSLAISSPTPARSVTRERGSGTSAGSTPSPATQQAGLTEFAGSGPPD